LAQTFGKYEVVTELYSTPEGSVYSARPVGSRRLGDAASARQGESAPVPASRGARELREVRYAVKVYNPTGLDMDELFWESQSFLERARLQQRTADAGNGNWAPVHEMGTSPAGAYYVTDFHPLSVAGLISGRVEVGPGVLYTIIRSVVAGLVELKDTAGRSHGNLKPSNVLISSRGDVAVAGAVLTDPAPAGVAAKTGEAGDLQALGELIYLLATGRSFPETGTWPVAPSRDWNRLGGTAGKHWRRLCNDLLDPDVEGRPSSLAAVARQLPRLAPRPPRRTRRAVLAAVSALLFIAVGALSMLVVQDLAARREIYDAKNRWAGPLAVALADSPARRRAIEADPDLRVVVQELASARLEQFDRPSDNRRFSLASILPAIINLKEFPQTQERLAAIRRAERGLAPPRWRHLSRATELQGQFEGWGWTQPATRLGERVAAARPGSSDLVGGIEQLLRLVPAVDRDLPRADAAWKQLLGRSAELEETGDPVLKSFAAALRKSAASSVRLSETGLENLDALNAAAGRASELADARAALRVPGDYDEERLALAVAAQFKPAELKANDVQRWLDTVAAHRVKRPEIAAAAERLRKLVEETGREVLDTKPEPDDKAEFDSQQVSVGGRIGAFARRPFIARDFDDGTFEAERARVEAEVLALRGYARREDPREWLKSVPLAKFSSRRLNEAWDSWRALAAEQAPQLAKDPVRYGGLKKQTLEQWNALGKLDESFPAPPRDLNDAFTSAALSKREEALDRLVRSQPVAELLASPELKTAVATYGQWAANLVELSKDFPLRQELLDPQATPDARWTTPEKSAFWNDPAVRRLVERDVQRLANLRGLAARPRAELAEIARTSQVPEIVVHAWRLLGSDKVEPAWPTQAGDLQRDADVRGRIDELLRQGVNRVEEKRRAASEVVAQGPVRWRRFAEAARNPAMLASAVQLRESFGVDEEQFARLGPAARFNLSLFAARQQIERYKANPAGAARAQNNDPALTTIVADLRKAAAELRSRPGVPELMQRVGTLDEKENFADRRLDDVFSLQPLGADVPLEFRRVEPRSRGERPFYLGTTEVSLAQFVAVVNAQTAWARVESLVWSPQPGDHGDTRRGPRTWVWARPAVQMGRAIFWLSPEEANSFPMELRDPRSKFNRNVLGPEAGGMPSDAHPMQYVSPEAALFFAGLCGCRLPTAHEWEVAYERFGKDVPAEKWNLRDKTWDAQRAYAASAGADEAAQMPDAGIFTMPKAPDGRAVATGPSARAGQQNDHTLFFRTVDSPELGAGASGGFHHLVGNVAEIVCDAAQPFEKYNDKATPEGVRRFATANAGAIAVIGGSALSPPELPLDKPLPVKPGAAYADVGFRLAFTAPSRSLAERLEWVLGEQDYLWPSTTNGARAAAGE